MICIWCGSNYNHYNSIEQDYCSDCWEEVVMFRQIIADQLYNGPRAFFKEDGVVAVLTEIIKLLPQDKPLESFIDLTREAWKGAYAKGDKS